MVSAEGSSSPIRASVMPAGRAGAGSVRGSSPNCEPSVSTGRPKIALQLYLYDQFLHAGLVRPGEKVVNSIYSTARLMTTPLPDVEESEAFSSMVEERLHGLLQEISNTAIPWRRTCDKHTCEMCDFRGICGR